MKSPDRGLFAKTLAAGACFSISASWVPGANNQIRVGIIGHGGAGDWRAFLAQPDVTPAAVCDADDPNREPAARMCKEKVAGLKDLRRLPDRPVTVATPSSLACPPGSHGLLPRAFGPRKFMKDRCLRWGMLQLANRSEGRGFSTLSSGRRRLHSVSNRKRALAEDAKRLSDTKRLMDVESD